MAFYLQKNTGRTEFTLCSSKMKYGILMRNVIFLGYKKTTKMIKPVNITRVLSFFFSPSLPYIQYFILIYLSSPLVSFGKKQLYGQEILLSIYLWLSLFLIMNRHRMIFFFCSSSKSGTLNLTFIFSFWILDALYKYQLVKLYCLLE